MQVALVRWRPRSPGRTAADLKAMLALGASPADGVAHVRVEDADEEWRAAVFLDAPTELMARTRLRELLRRTAAVMPDGPELIDIEIVTAWFRHPV